MHARQYWWLTQIANTALFFHPKASHGPLFRFHLDSRLPLAKTGLCSVTPNRPMELRLFFLLQTRLPNFSPTQ